MRPGTFVPLMVVAAGCVVQTGAVLAKEQVHSLAEYPGIWESQGYGQILDVTPERLIVYDVTDVSCLQVEEEVFPQADTAYERIKRTGTQLSFFWEGGVTQYTFSWRAQLPLRCMKREGGADPEYVLAVLWHAFRENYAFFEQRGVDWGGLYDRLRPRALKARTDEELFAVLREAVEALDDGHVDLTAGVRRFDGGRLGELRESWLAERGIPADRWRDVANDYRVSVDAHVAGLLGKTRKTGAHGILAWGWLRPGVGYLSIASMYMTVPKGLPALRTAAQLEAIDDAMSRAIADLAKARAVVLDVRFNGGGYDSLALRIAGFFTSKPRVAMTKQAVFRGGLTDAQPLMIEPRGHRQYLGPVFVLQSGSTVSAAEIFVIATKALPNVKRIGTRTYGALSDAMEKELPKGWKVTISNEVYLAADGRSYEHIGVPPDIPIEVPETQFDKRVQQDIDVVLESISEVANRSDFKGCCQSFRAAF